jgi:hypothetical protein
MLKYIIFNVIFFSTWFATIAQLFSTALNKMAFQVFELDTHFC